MKIASHTTGVLSAIAAFALWGFFPFYWKWLDHLGPIEIVCHRIIWSMVLSYVVLTVLGKNKNLLGPLFDSQKRLALMCACVLVTINWLLFVYAVVTSQLVEASLGYYINPLFNVGLGAVVLKEKLNRIQWIAVTLAAFGVMLLTVKVGSVPLIALGLASSFSLYGLVKKRTGLSALPGMFVETLLLTPIALTYLAVVYYNSTAEVTLFNTRDMGLLILGGIVTLTPLYLFAEAANRIKLSTLGFFQYIGPSLQLVIAVGFYHEPFSRGHFVSFAFIWMALVLYSGSNLKRLRF